MHETKGAPIRSPLRRSRGDEYRPPRRSISCLHERSSELRTPRKRSIEFAVAGPIAREEIPRLCNALGRLLERSTVEVVVFDLGALVRADAVTVDALARLHLTARRLGFGVRLRKASPELRELISFMGLRAAMQCESSHRLTT